jgi:hypothetical protein
MEYRNDHKKINRESLVGRSHGLFESATTESYCKD